MLLIRFIAKYVLCPEKKCKKPEISIFIKNNQIRSKCKACSHIDNLDNKHKLANYIIKFPPKDISDMKGIGLQKQEPTDKPNKIQVDIKKLKATIKKMTEAVSKNADQEVKSIINETAADPSINSPDCKYFIYLHGIYGKEIYEVFEERVAWLKYVSLFILIIIKAIEADKKATRDESSYHILISLINLFMEKFIKEKDVMEDLERKISSVLYLFYKEQVFTEEFIINKFRKSNISFSNIFLNSTAEQSFIAKAEEFVKWIETAPFDDEELAKPEEKLNKDIDDL